MGRVSYAREKMQRVKSCRKGIPSSSAVIIDILSKHRFDT